VGRITDVRSDTSTVTLINDPNISVSARVQRSRQEGLVCGSLGGTLLMKFLPKDCDIAAGDRIITSGLTAVYPKGILIAPSVRSQAIFRIKHVCDCQTKPLSWQI